MALIKSDSFIGTTGSQDSDKYQMHMKWEQHSIDGNYTQTKVIAKMYFWSKWEWHSTVFADSSHITINGNLARPSSNVDITGTGERLVLTHTAIISHSTAINISISGRCDIHKSYDTPYWYGVEGSTTISLSAPPTKPTPSAPSNIQPTSGNYKSGQAVTISWNKSTISSGSVTYHRVFVNGVNIANVNGTTTSYTWYIPSADAIGTKYTASVDALSDLSVPSSRTSATGSFYKVASIPSTPTNIKPNSGEYAGDVTLTWDASTVNNSTIEMYNVYINNKLTWATENTSISWYVPNGDTAGTSYMVSVEAISANGEKSNRGYATGSFYKAETNSAPNTPTISIKNSLIGGRYVVESTLDIELSQVIDPDGDTVRYGIFGEYLSPDSSTWQSLGDVNKCVLWSTSSRSVSVSTKNHYRGTQFRVWGKATDDKASSNNTSTISNIYKNQAPNKIKSISPTAYTFYANNLSINWNDAGDPDNQTVRYKIELIKNNSNIGTVRSYSTSASFSYEVSSADDSGTTYQFRITPNDGIVDGTATTSPIYTKGNLGPTTPKNIKPNSGFYKYNVNINWDESEDPEGENVMYNVYINRTKINNYPISNNYIEWNIPNSDSYGTSYLIGVEAIDSSGNFSSMGYATGLFCKADMLSHAMNIFVEDVNVIEVLGVKKYFQEIHLKYWYENTGISLSYILQYAIIEETWDSILIENLNWKNIVSGTSEQKWNYDISLYNNNQSIVFRVKASDGYGDSTSWAYSNICNIYANKSYSDCNIIYPIAESTIYTKRPYLCVQCSNEILSDSWLCLTVNGTVFNNLLSNQTGNLVIKCPIDLNEGINQIKIRQDKKIENLSTINGQTYTLQVNYEKLDVEFENYIKESTTSNIFLAIESYSKSYGINFKSPNIISNKTEIEYFGTIGIMREIIESIAMKINNFYKTTTAISYAWKKYKIAETTTSAPLVIEEFANPRILQTMEIAQSAVTGYTDYYFDSKKAYVLTGEKRTITGSVSDVATTVYIPEVTASGLNFSILEYTLKSSPSLQSSISPRFNVSFICRTRRCDVIYRDNSSSTQTVKEYIGIVYASSPNFYPTAGTQNGFYYEKISKMYKWSKYSVKTTGSYYELKFGPPGTSNATTLLIYDSYSFSSTNGKFSMKGNSRTITVNDNKSKTFYYGTGIYPSSITKYSISSTGVTTVVNLSSIKKEGVEKAKDQYLGSVESFAPDEYPQDGIHSDGCWYIFDGYIDNVNNGVFEEIKLSWEESGPGYFIKKSLFEEIIDAIDDF